jgi:hypothetical protein
MAVTCGLILAGGGGAYAQEEVELAPTVTRQPGTEHLRTPFGTSIQLGGGVTNFISETTRDATNVGGYWDVRAVLGTRTYAALELAYVGNAQDIEAVGLDPNAYLMGNGAEGALRLQMPFMSQDVMMAPFAFAGIGWMHYSVVNDDFNTSLVRGSDDIGTVPLGAGFAVGYRGFIADARFTYRQAFDDDNLFPVISESGEADLQSWAVGMMVGAEF